MDELFQVPSEAPTMDSLVSFPIVIGAILFCSGKRRVVLDRSRTPDPGLVLNGIEDFVDEEPEQGELLYRIVDSERT